MFAAPAAFRSAAVSNIYSRQGFRPMPSSWAGRAASFHELDSFGERHGSWQRTIHAWSAPDHLDRYVVAAFTSFDDGDEVAVMAGAEERSIADSAGRPRFRRFDVGSIRLNGDNLNLWPTPDIKNLLALAVRMAIEIQPVQLEEMQLLAS
jgi:hypothetical protein